MLVRVSFPFTLPVWSLTTSLCSSAVVIVSTPLFCTWTKFIQQRLYLTIIYLTYNSRGVRLLLLLPVEHAIYSTLSYSLNSEYLFATNFWRSCIHILVGTDGSRGRGIVLWSHRADIDLSHSI